LAFLYYTFISYQYNFIYLFIYFYQFSAVEI